MHKAGNTSQSASPPALPTCCVGHSQLFCTGAILKASQHQPPPRQSLGQLPQNSLVQEQIQGIPLQLISRDFPSSRSELNGTKNIFTFIMRSKWVFNTRSMGPQKPIPSASPLASGPAICSNHFASCLVVVPDLQVTASAPATRPPPGSCPCPTAFQSPKSHRSPSACNSTTGQMGALQSISHVLPGEKPLAPALTIYLEEERIKKK